MKQVKRVVLIVIGVLLLAACTGAAALQPTVEATTDEVTVAEPTNLNLIGQTGRPQLLNAYASW